MTTIENNELKREIKLYLRKLGISPDLTGYSNLTEAILFCINDPSLMSNITTRIYPAIADNIHSTTSAVEGSMRHAIQIADKEKLYPLFENLLRPGKVVPTNKQFIITVVEEIKFNLNIYD